MMSTLNNNTSNKYLHSHSLNTTNDQSPLQTTTNVIQLPPLSYLLGKKSSPSASIPTFRSSNSLPLPESTPTKPTSNNNNKPPLFQSKSAPASRLPSISDLLPPSLPQQQQQQQQQVEHKQDLSSSSTSSLKTPIKEHHSVPSTFKLATTTTTTSASTEKKAYAFISHSPATFPSHEPSIDNAQLARRKRRRTSPNELSILQHEFEMGHTPNKARRQEIASKVNMTEKAVQIWFQNKRQAIRKLQLSDQSIHQTTTITLPEVDVATSPITSTPIKFFDTKADSFATSPISASSNSSNDIPIIAGSSTTADHSDLRSSPPPHQQQLQHLPPPRPATWTMVNPAKLNPVTPVRNPYPHQQHHQLPTPNVVSFRLNKIDATKSTAIPTSNVLPPTPSSSAKFSHKKPMMRVLPLDPSAKSPSPADSKVKTMMSLSNLNSPPVVSLENSNKRKILGDITNTNDAKRLKHLKKETKKEGEIECVEHLLSLRSANWK